MIGKLLPLLPLALLTQPSLACGLTCRDRASFTISSASAISGAEPILALDQPTQIASLPSPQQPTDLRTTAISLNEISASGLSSQPTFPYQSSFERGFAPVIPYLSSLFSSALPNQRTIFEDSFNNDLSNFKVDSGARDTHGAVIRPDPLTSGNAVRLEARRDDPIANNKIRSELVPSVNRDEFEFGTDYFYQFRMYLPPEWEIDDVSDVVAQWHGRPDRDLGEPYRRPPLSFSVDGDVFELITRSDSAQVTDRSSPDETFTELTAWTAPIERGRWIDWGFHIRWSYDGDGIIRIWKDGQHIHTHRGANAYNDRTPPYFKLGIYKWIWTRNPERSRVDRRVIWLDDISIGILD